ncbi:putative cytochrome P450 [Aspergillus pseudotamarii]|uniref:Putative cytochrome P450 n=1 Tax=Aspergillus pseudotamarii TaxID=132259 RepID=A0A5N6TB82_ASPPS|nr:putative cytochrome P450 [Aspergillus pseudotamarii]KAE8143645.1 putative cytochrome P450 [Aspergillus pseudotamarii]
MSSSAEVGLYAWMQRFSHSRLSASGHVSLPSGVSAVIGIIIIVAVGFCLGSSQQRLIPGIPIVGGQDSASIKKNRTRFVHDGMNMLLEGYRQNNGGLYYVPSKLGERLMLPTKYLEELKSAPIDEVDFVATFIEMFEGKYTTMGSRSTLHPRVVRGQLNRNLWTVMDGIQDEIRDAFDDAFPPCDDWTELDVVDRITQVVARVSSRMFGGTTLSRNKEWVKSSIAFAIDGFIGAQALKRYPEFLKPLVARFIPAIQNIKKHYAAAEKAAIPLLEERAATGASAADLLYWMDEDAKGDEKNRAFLAGILLKVSFAAIHTSAAAPSQLLYDLCAMPEYIEPLRQEIEANTGPDGKINQKGFLNMTKLDSIMKESQRFNPLLLITFERVVTKDYPLSDGLIIPANTTIGIPTHAISMDPALYPDAEVFQGFRFAEAAKQAKQADSGDKSAKEKPAASTSVAYAASHPSSMAFGYGRHACPGRFFASAEIKAIMAYLLRNYEFKYPPEQTGRPPSLLFETQNLPNPEGKILFKRRK